MTKVKMMKRSEACDYMERHRDGRKDRVTIFFNGQFIIVYTCKPHINHEYSLVLITPRIFSSVAFRLMRKIVTQSLRPLRPWLNCSVLQL
jgi:hypothetical protein